MFYEKMNCNYRIPHPPTTPSPESSKASGKTHVYKYEVTIWKAQMRIYLTFQAKI
jgi:hypothetical protein